MRVRADAGQSSVRKAGRLEELREEAKHQVETLKHRAQTNPEELTNRQRAARPRAGGGGASGTDRAGSAPVPGVAAEKGGKRQGKKRKEKSSQPRASTTDPEARILKFRDGGGRPGVKVPFATDTATGLVVGVDVTNAGTDSEEMPPMLDQLETRYDTVPDEMLVDGGFASLKAIDATAARPCKVYAPVKDAEKPKKAGPDRYSRKPHDTAHTAAWRKRMGEEAAPTADKLRAQTAEWVNAMCRNRGFGRMPLRGRVKCRIVATRLAITPNLIHQGNVRAAVAEARG
jgi:Transposase DDE domain